MGFLQNLFTHFDDLLEPFEKRGVYKVSLCWKRKTEERKDCAGGGQHHPRYIREGGPAWAYSQRRALTVRKSYCGC